jgi:hypothetical protein
MIEKVLSPLMTLGSESLRRTASASRAADTRIQMIYSIDTAGSTHGDGDVSVAQGDVQWDVAAGLSVRLSVCCRRPLSLTSHANSNLVVSLGGADMAEEERAGRGKTREGSAQGNGTGRWMARHSQRQRQRRVACSDDQSVTVPTTVDCHVSM